VLLLQDEDAGEQKLVILVRGVQTQRAIKILLRLDQLLLLHEVLGVEEEGLRVLVVELEDVQIDLIQLLLAIKDFVLRCDALLVLDLALRCEAEDQRVLLAARLRRAEDLAGM